MKISIRCKIHSIFGNRDIIEYNFNCSDVVFDRLIRVLKYTQLCNVFEMENVDHELGDERLIISQVNLNEKYITMYVNSIVLEFYIYLDPIRDQILQVSELDSLGSIFCILDAVADPINDPKVDELFDDMYVLDNPSPNLYPVEALKYSIINEFHDIVSIVFKNMQSIRGGDVIV